MKHPRSFRIMASFPRISLFVIGECLLIAGIAFTQEERPSRAPLNPAFAAFRQQAARGTLPSPFAGGHALGYRPGPLDLRHNTSRKPALGVQPLALPAAYDLRTLGRVSPIRNQGNCGSCWAFATMASLESWLLGARSETWNFSENNLKECTGFDIGSCDGGNHLMSTAYLARGSGPVAEADDRYNDSDGSCATGKRAQKYVEDALWLPDRASVTDNDTIKKTVMDYGAVYTTMYFGTMYYHSNDKTYYYSGPNGSNHGVAIVGWDNNKSVTGAPGKGAFIVRNSWGTSWGENGYFYISYYDSNIGKDNACFINAVEPGTYQEILQYDPLGQVISAGYGSSTAWAANIFRPSRAGQLVAVGTYANTVNTAYVVSVYANFSNGRFSNQLTTQSGTFASPGYHTIHLNSPAPVGAAKDIGIVIKYTTPGYNSPIPVETAIDGWSSSASASSGQSYMSSNGTTFTDITTWSGWESTNVCIKGLTLPAGFQCDAMVRHAGDASYTGDNVYNLDGTNQSVAYSTSAQTATVYECQVQNDGGTYDSFTLKGSGGGSGWTVKYFDAHQGGNDITNSVTGNGWTTQSLAPGDAAQIRIEVTGDATVPGGGKKEVLVTASSREDSSKKDAIKSVTSVVATVEFVSDSQRSSTESETMNVVVKLSGVLDVNVTVPFSVGGTAKSPDDYTIPQSPVTISAGSTMSVIVITIKPDSLDEPDETVVLTLGTPTNAARGACPVHTATIVDDDATPVVTFTSSSQSSVKEGGTMKITAQLSSVTSQEVTVPFTLSGTATCGADYTISSSPARIPAGSSTAIITITVQDDVVDEPNETIVVTLGTPTHANLGAITEHVATITDDDPTPTVQFTTSAQIHTEGGSVAIFARLSNASSRAVTVPFTLSGTATVDVDYAAHASPLVIAPGETTGSLTLFIRSDTLDESNETIVVTMGVPMHAVEGQNRIHTVTLTDDDAAPGVKFTSASQTHARESGTLTLTAQLSTASGQAVTIPFTVSGTATRGVDYTITSSPITITAGAPTATITISLIDDPRDEADETIIITMGTPTNATKGSTTIHTATITDDDAPPTVQFTVSEQVSSYEGGGMTVTAVLSAASGLPVTLPFTLGGTATRDTDYRVTAGPLVISSGTTGSITITVIGDTIDEPDETVIATLGTPMNAILGARCIHTATIVDDDPTPNSRQPDLLIRVSGESSYAGDGIYNTTGGSQARDTKGPRQSTATYLVRLQNDGNAANTFRVSATAGGSGWTVRYYDAANGGNDVTTSVTAGGWMVSQLAAGGIRDMRVEVVPGSSVANGARKDVFITATSSTDSSKKDVVKAITTVRVGTTGVRDVVVLDTGVAGWCDVVLTSFSVLPNPACRGGTVTFSYTVANLGAQTARGVCFRLVENGQVAGTVKNIGDLTPGQQYRGVTQLTVSPTGASGEYLITGQVTCTNEDSHKSNNAQTLKLVVR